MDFVQVALAVLFFANPYGRFLVLAGRTSGVYLLQSQGFGPEIIFVAFALASTFGTLAGHYSMYAFKNILVKKFRGFFKELERHAYRFKGWIGEYGVFIGLATTSAFTSPLYASALATALNASFIESLAAIIFSNFAYFAVLYALVQGVIFDIGLVLLAVAAFLILGWLLQSAMKRRNR